MKPNNLLNGLVLATLLFGLTTSQSLASQLPVLTPSEALGTSFTYQGYLADNGSPANGLYDFQFNLFNVSSGGSAIAGPVSIDDVSVANGYFTVSIDFGGTHFAGDKRWLEIAAKRDADSSYTIFSQRQELTATPYALYARTAPWSGLSGVPAGFADNIDNDTLYTAGTGLNLTGTQFSADTNYLQRRVAMNCVAGSAIRAIDAGGTPTCENDDDTTYTAGTGLNLIGTQFSADANYLQRRVTPGCRVGSIIREVKQDGTVTCWDDAPLNRSVPPGNPILAQPAPSATIGGVNVVTIGADGLPLVFYSDTAVNRYFFAHCSDPTCSSATRTRVDDFTPGNDYGSMTIDPTGVGVASYYEPASSSLYFARCTDIACTGVITNTLFFGPSTVGMENDITIAQDGFPLVAFVNGLPGPGPVVLQSIHCLDAACSIPPPPGMIDPTPNLVNPDPTITLGADGLGLIAYFFSPTQDLRIAHCNDPACMAATLTTLVTAIPDGLQPSITTGVDGLGLVAYVDLDSFSLWTAHCNDGQCVTATQQIIAKLMPGNLTPYPNVTIGAFGMGIISYYDLDISSGTLSTLVANCHNLACTSATLNPAALATHYPSWITLAPSGNPILTFPNGGNSQLFLQFCSSPFCVPNYKRR